MRANGVDGCRGGWLAASVVDGEVAWRWSERIGDVLAEADGPIGIDMPIGLPEAGARACDRQARRLVGPRAASVFPAPVRAVLSARTYPQARALLAAAGAGSMSAQAFALVPAVRELDEAMSAAREDQVAEVHPEVSFTLLAGTPLPPKRSVPGAATRIAALTRWLPGVLDALARAPAQARLDDALDALAVAWSAARWAGGDARTLGDGSRDARGLLMRIVG